MTPTRYFADLSPVRLFAVGVTLLSAACSQTSEIDSANAAPASAPHAAESAPSTTLAGATFLGPERTFEEHMRRMRERIGPYGEPRVAKAAPAPAADGVARPPTHPLLVKPFGGSSYNGNLEGQFQSAVDPNSAPWWVWLETQTTVPPAPTAPASTNLSNGTAYEVYLYSALIAPSSGAVIQPVIDFGHFTNYTWKVYTDCNLCGNMGTPVTVHPGDVITTDISADTETCNLAGTNCDWNEAFYVNGSYVAGSGAWYTLPSAPTNAQLSALEAYSYGSGGGIYGPITSCDMMPGGGGSIIFSVDNLFQPSKTSLYSWHSQALNPTNIGSTAGAPNCGWNAADLASPVNANGVQEPGSTLYY